MSNIVSPIQIQATVTCSTHVAEGIYLVELESPQIAAKARPGQFAMLKCGGGAFLRRPLGIHRVSGDRTKVSFLFAVVGKGTEWLSEIRAGDTVDILGPLGNGFTIDSCSKSVLLVAGGLGIAPLVFLAEEAQASGLSVNLAYGTAGAARYDKALLPGVARLLEYTDDGSYGRQGLVTQCIPEFIGDVGQIFACGPLPMYRGLAKHDLAGIPVQVSLETRMACGLGVCYGCGIKTKSGLRQVCNDGPVFDMDEVVWDELR
ncbi:MAG: dihydroorotate dehydrogenase electron transfer subunit [Dehalococcoidia bacterium]|nr:dihydroorotate dehydrogenase electron transfer subunit [Dehalococcoidia bacterium]